MLPASDILNAIGPMPATDPLAQFLCAMAMLPFVNPFDPAAMMTPREIEECAVWYFGDEARGLRITVH